MGTRWVVFAVAVAATTSVARAGVDLVYTPTQIPVGETTEVTMSLVGNPGLNTTLGAVIVDFGPGSNLAELNPTSFEFDSPLATDPWTWEVTLPNVVQSVWGGGMGGGPALLAEQSVNIGSLFLHPTTPGTWTLDANLEVFNSSDFDSIAVDSGDPHLFRVVPEPASFALLAIGAAALVRRMRR